MQQQPSSNHIEADTQIIMEALNSESNIFFKTTDAGILSLICYVYSSEDKW